MMITLTLVFILGLILYVRKRLSDHVYLDEYLAIIEADELEFFACYVTGEIELCHKYCVIKYSRWVGNSLEYERVSIGLRHTLSARFKGWLHLEWRNERISSWKLNGNILPQMTVKEAGYASSVLILVRKAISRYYKKEVV